jgi:hypothetical protein
MSNNLTVSEAQNIQSPPGNSLAIFLDKNGNLQAKDVRGNVYPISNYLPAPIKGTGTINRISKFTASGTIGDSQIFDNGTNVGIGTTSPSARLDVRAQGALATDIAFRVRSFAGGDNLASINGIGDGAFKRLSVSSVLESWMPAGSLVAGNAYFTVGTFGGSGSGFQLKSSTLLNSIYTGSSQAFDAARPFAIQTFNGGRTWLYINTSGNVGIGATSPQAKLDVRAQGALATDIAFRVRNSTDTANLLQVNGQGTLSLGLQSSAPTGIEGAIYYDSTTKKHYGFDGITWNALY